MLKLIPLMALSLGLAACVPSHHPAYLVAADPAVGSGPPADSSVTAGVRAYDVVEPLDWRELNRQVAPGAAPERGDANNPIRRGR